MPEIRFLTHGDLKYISGNLTGGGYFRVEPKLERGFIALFSDGQEPYCEFVVSDGKTRYFVKSHVSQINAFGTEETGIYPEVIINIRKYRALLNAKMEARIFKLLQQAYLKGDQLDFDDFVSYARLLSKSKEELKEEAKTAIGYDSSVRCTGGIIGIMIGWLIGDSIDSSIAVGAATAAGGIIDSSIPEIRLWRAVKRKEKELRLEMLGIQQDLEAKLRLSRA